MADAEEKKSDIEAEDDKFIKTLKDKGINTVVFDMDRTACRVHSGGILIREKLENYIKRASGNFVRIVPKLHTAKFNFAIASFADTKNYNEKHPFEKYIAGTDLISEFLYEHFPDEICSKFKMYGYNPILWKDDPVKSKDPNNKNPHIDDICRDFKVEKKQIILFDDSKKNVKAAIEHGAHAKHVNEKHGFRLIDLYKNDFYIKEKKYTSEEQRSNKNTLQKRTPTTDTFEAKHAPMADEQLKMIEEGDWATYFLYFNMNSVREKWIEGKGNPVKPDEVNALCEALTSFPKELKEHGYCLHPLFAVMQMQILVGDTKLMDSVATWNPKL